MYTEEVSSFFLHMFIFHGPSAQFELNLQLKEEHFLIVVDKRSSRVKGSDCGWNSIV